MRLTVPDYTDLLGKPFAYGGRGPGEYDCYGLAIELYRRSGVTLPDYTSTSDPAVQGALFTDGAEKYFERVSIPRPMDIALLRVARGGWHCGVVVDGYERFVHIMERCSVAREELHDPVWKNRIVGIYRYRGGLCNG